MDNGTVAQASQNAYRCYKEHRVKFAGVEAESFFEQWARDNLHWADELTKRSVWRDFLKMLEQRR